MLYGKQRLGYISDTDKDISSGHMKDPTVYDLDSAMLLRLLV